MLSCVNDDVILNQLPLLKLGVIFTKICPQVRVVAVSPLFARVIVLVPRCFFQKDIFLLELVESEKPAQVWVVVEYEFNVVHGRLS